MSLQPWWNNERQHVDLLQQSCSILKLLTYKVFCAIHVLCSFSKFSYTIWRWNHIKMILKICNILVYCCCCIWPIDLFMVLLCLITSHTNPMRTRFFAFCWDPLSPHILTRMSDYQHQTKTETFGEIVITEFNSDITKSWKIWLIFVQTWDCLHMVYFTEWIEHTVYTVHPHKRVF